MNEVSVYFLGIFIMIICSLIVVLFLRKKLLNILEQLTGSKERASFWMTFSNILLFLVPLIFTMSVYPEVNRGKTVETVYSIMTQLKWGLIGLVLSLLVMAFILMGFIKRFRDPNYED